MPAGGSGRSLVGEVVGEVQLLLSRSVAGQVRDVDRNSKSRVLASHVHYVGTSFRLSPCRQTRHVQRVLA
jgi:hypothetical protein